MRTIFMALSFMVTGMQTLHAQKAVFIKHSHDFENKLGLTYATNDGSDENKIRFNEFIAKPYLIVKHNGEKIHVFKDEIHAYKNKGNIARTGTLHSIIF